VSVSLSRKAQSRLRGKKGKGKRGKPRIKSVRARVVLVARMEVDGCLLKSAKGLSGQPLRGQLVGLERLGIFLFFNKGLGLGLSQAQAIVEIPKPNQITNSGGRSEREGERERD